MGGEVFLPLPPENPEGHLELASLKVIVVKIELAWEGMENSCSCLGLGAREADGQARAWMRNLDLRSSEHTPHLPDSREQSWEGAWNLGMQQVQGFIYTMPCFFQGTCVCLYRWEGAFRV